MAVTLVSSPPDIIAAGNPARWCLSIDDLGTMPDNKKVIAFQLEDDAGKPLHAMEAISPRAAGFAECIPYDRNIRNLVHTSVPDLTAPISVWEDVNAMIKIALKYGEIEYDFLNCETNVNVETKSEVHTLINSAFPLYQKPFIGESFIMSNRPKVMDFNSNSLDWLWIYGASSVNITAYNAAGVASNIGTAVTEADKVNVVPIGRGHYSMPGSTVRIRIRVTIGANVTDYWYFETCHSCKNYNEVLFLERYGGRCTVLFDCKPSVSVNTSYQEIFRHVGVIPNDSDTVYDQKLLSTGGRTIANKQSWESVTLTKVLPDDPKIIDFYKEFLSSHSYHLRYEKNQWERGYIKFIVESGSIRIYEDSEETVLQITGRYHLPENMATDGQ